jgi:hypothetical protein
MAQRAFPSSVPPPSPRRSSWPVAPSDEPFLPFAAQREILGEVTHVRSTLVTASLQALRQRGLYASYLARLDPSYADEIVTTVAGAWLPLTLGQAHYGACNVLEVEEGLVIDVGMEVGDRVHGTFLGAMLRSARTVGATPWTALAQSRRLYERLFSGGGGIAVFRRGPKDAIVCLEGNALCDVPYFRTGVCGVYRAALQLFASRLYVTEAPGFHRPATMALKIAWL